AEMFSENKLLNRQLVISGLLSLLVFCLGLKSNLVEQLYSGLFYKYVSLIQRTISGIFPFSLGDILYLLFIALLVYQVYKYLSRLRIQGFKRHVIIAAPIGVLNFTLILY